MKRALVVSILIRTITPDVSRQLVRLLVTSGDANRLAWPYVAGVSTT